MKLRKIIAVLLAIVMLLPLFCLGTDSYADAADNGWNIMFVIDGSGSLKKTDPTGLRYEAVNMVIDLLPDTGCYMGAIVFDANEGHGTTESDMFNCVVNSYPIQEINNRSDKAALKSGISADMSSKNGTDYCTALLMAQEQLSRVKNGKPSAILLFTDGALALPGGDNVKKVAIENGHIAAQTISDTLLDNDPDNDIRLCGIFLNADGKEDSSLLKTLVRESLGNLPETAPLNEHFIEIRSSYDLPDALDQFGRLLGMNIPPIKGDPLPYGWSDHEFRIPGAGVREANFRITSESGANLPSGLDVNITRPDGSVLTTAEKSSICSSGTFFQIYKIMNPASGIWKISIYVPEDCGIAVYFEPILNFSINAEMETDPPASDLHVNTDLSIKAYLEENGSRLLTADSYSEYSCEALFTDLATGEKYTYPIPQDSNGLFELKTRLDRYTTLECSIRFSCGEEISISSPPMVWNLSNRIPTSKAEVYTTVYYGLLSSGKETLNLAGKAFDIKDLEDDFDHLTIRIAGGTVKLDGCTLSSDGKLEIDAVKAGKGDIILEIADTQGATCQTTVHVNTVSTTRSVLITAGAIILVALLLTLFIVRIVNRVKTEGTCSLTIDVPNENGTGDIKTVTVDELSPPGSFYSGRHKTNLRALLGEIEETREEIRTGCREGGVTFEQFKKTVEQLDRDLRAAKLKCVIFRDKKKHKFSSNKLKLRYGRIKRTLENGEVESFGLKNNGINVQLAYHIEEDEDEVITYSGPKNDFMGETKEEREAFSPRSSNKESKNEWMDD